MTAGNYCSVRCETADMSALASDGALESPSGLSKLPALEPGHAHRSGSFSSTPSTPPSSPNTSPHLYMPIGTEFEPSKLNLPPALSEEKPGQLFFDYRYAVRCSCSILPIKFANDDDFYADRSFEKLASKVFADIAHLCLAIIDIWS